MRIGAKRLHMPVIRFNDIQEEPTKHAGLQKVFILLSEAAMRKMIMMALAGFLWRKFNAKYMGGRGYGGRTMRRSRF